ncbi:unnamed protein product [Arctia plantaginis]|uniref:Ig-like domain-containing protein n=1 Tax=Arctia plantaginis TaxID=874455 RepID=A0A8S1B138_ARCPL|nr:unnamed protein product [Arctia plantaginis]CAB3251287.1 unnamed protein product [Arctia plantaginis]
MEPMHFVLNCTHFSNLPDDHAKVGVTSLRDVVLIVEPSIVIRGGTAALVCSRDMQGVQLYSVKWYRGNHEFYRYTPNEVPDTRVFGLPGIIVDMNRSNGTQVLLRKLDLGLAGNFTCEVTAESPSFATQVATKFIDVIALPPSGPVLKADKDRYQPGEVLQANCTSSPAKPAANLTIFINEEALRSSEMSLHPTDNGLYWTNVKADIKVTQDLFIGGRLRVACLASVYEVYRSSANLDFFTPETDPRPERITHNDACSAKCFRSWLVVLFIFLLPMVMGQDFDAPEHEYEDYDEIYTKHPFESLVGG